MPFLIIKRTGLENRFDEFFIALYFSVVESDDLKTVDLALSL